MNGSTWDDAQALAYIASYADLRAVLGADPEAGRRHYATAGQREGRSIRFDALGYTASYGDLRGAFGIDAEAAARHYILSGAREGRTPSFDALSYIASYADLRAVYGTDTASATRHYIQWGANEGRGTSFDALAYLASYADLRAAFGTDTTAATRHFIKEGAAEGRAVTFDPWSYLASNADLRAAYGTDTRAVTQHYLAWGAAEGRTVTFDALSYTASYADLSAAFGTDLAAATRHFVTAGAAEGRVPNALLAGPKLAEASDSGRIGDDITSNSTLTVEGRAASGSLVKVSVDGRAVGTAVANGVGGKWTYDVADLSDGTHRISASVGNSASLGVAITVDSIDPLRPDTPTLTPASDTGVANDGRTTVVRPVIQGTAEVGSNVLIYLDGRRVGTVATDAAGAWTYEVASALSVGSHQVHVRSVDTAGNVSDRSDALALRIQVPVDAATLTTGSDDIVTSDSGAIVSATAATLTASTTMPIPVAPWSQTVEGDRLIGGTGYDTLQLYGAGEFRVDRLGAFAGFEKILLSNLTPGIEASIYLGAQDIAVGVTQGNGMSRLYLGSGKVTIEGLRNSSVTVTSAANWNKANVIKATTATSADPYPGPISVIFGAYSYGTIQTYDLRAATLKNVSINSNTGAIFLVDSAVMAGVSSWYAYTYTGENTLSTADAAIDLGTASVSGFKIVSTNTAGTIFSTGNATAALQVQGGAGQDTLVLRGTTFTTDQRNTIFATSSIETITDAGGTYIMDPNMVRLTSGIDRVVMPATGGTVVATAATLTASAAISGSTGSAGDELIGGAGEDTLQLYGGGDFRIDRLGSFTNFEKILITNPRGGAEARIYLGAQDIALGVSRNSGSSQIYLGSGKVTIDGLIDGTVNVTSTANWNTGNVIRGTAPTPSNPFATTINVTFGDYSAASQTFDLRSATLSWVNLTSRNASTFLVNSAAMTGVSNWSSYYLGTSTLSTGDAAIDLGTASISGFKIVSTNTTGTTFSTERSATAMQVQGGTGQDTLVLRGSVFTVDQRNTIFATSSIETITDAGGTYAIDPNMVRLTSGADRVVMPAAGGTVTATAETLTARAPIIGSTGSAGDQLIGAAGYDTLQLYGSGEFHIDRLGSFTDFEKVLLTNPSGGAEARIYLGDQDIAMATSQGNGSSRVYLGSGKVTIDGLSNGSVTVTSAANWNVGNIIKGTAPTPSSPYASPIGVTFENYSSVGIQTYDLRTATLAWMYVNATGGSTFLVNSSAMAGITNWSGYSYSSTNTISVADAAIDLGSASITGFSVVSTNAGGTVFSTSNITAALQVKGGAGQDTLTLRSLTFTLEQRNAIFATGSIETITDASGTYTKPAASVMLSSDIGLFGDDGAFLTTSSHNDAQTPYSSFMSEPSVTTDTSSGFIDEHLPLAVPTLGTMPFQVDYAFL